MIEEKINFLFMLIEIVFVLIVLLLLIWVYRFVRRNLGLDKQTQELKKIRQLIEDKFKN
jgi:membrane protein implicated in regulation of membrane protease activity